MSQLFEIAEKMEAREADPDRACAQEILDYGNKTGRLSNEDFRTLKRALKAGGLCYEDFGYHKGNVNDWNARWLGENRCSPRD